MERLSSFSAFHPPLYTLSPHWQWTTDNTHLCVAFYLTGKERCITSLFWAKFSLQDGCSSVDVAMLKNWRNRISCIQHLFSLDGCTTLKFGSDSVIKGEFKWNLMDNSSQSILHCKPDFKLWNMYVRSPKTMFDWLPDQPLLNLWKEKWL